MTLRIDPALPKVMLNSLDRGLVLNISLDQESYNPATKRFTDKTPYSNHGTSYNDATFTTDHIGQPNRAMSFNGTDDYVDCGNGASLNITDAITIEAWVKADDYNTNSYVASKGRDAYAGYHIRFKDNKFYTLLYTETGLYNSGTPVSGAGFHHCVITYHKDNGGFFMLDGQNVKTIPAKGKIVWTGYETNPLLIGAMSYKQMYKFNGAIDEVRIYNRALSADEITTLYEQYRTKFLI